MKIKKYWPLIIGVIVIVAVLVVLSINKKPESKQPELILFYGDTCPHCKNVEEYMTVNNTRAKIQFQELEVYNNQDNARLLVQKAKKCGLETANGVGVPFWSNGDSCLVGDEDIINYFKQQ